MNPALSIAHQHQLAEIQRLIDRVDELAGSAAGQHVQRIVQVVLDMHTEALKRVIGRLKQAGEAGQSMLNGIAGDDLLASLLVLHNLHPSSMADRVRVAVDKVRPYLQSHGGDVEFVEAAGESVHLRMKGPGETCPAVADSLRQVIEMAVHDAAPDVDSIHIEATQQAAG